MRKITALTVAGFASLQLSASEPAMIGSLSLPSLMDVAQNVSDFSQKINPSYPMFILGGVTSLTFNPKLSEFDFLSPISSALFANDKGDTIHYSVSLQSKSKSPTVSFFGQKLFQKRLSQKSLLSNSKETLKKINKIETTHTDNSLLTIELFPAKYFQKCPTHYQMLKSNLMKSYKNSNNIASKISAAELALKDTSRVLIDLFTAKDGLLLKIRLKAISESKMSTLISELESIKGQVAFPLTDDRNDVDSMKSSQLNQKLQIYLSRQLGDENKMALLQKIFKHSSGLIYTANHEIICDLKVSPKTIKELISSKSSL